MKKISRRSFLAAAGVSAAALALTACGGSSNSTAASTATSAAASTAPAGDAAAAASDPKVTLVYAEVNPLDTIVGQTGSHFAVLFNSSHASPRQYKVLPGMMHPPFCLFSKTNYSIHPSGRLCKWRA